MYTIWQLRSWGWWMTELQLFQSYEWTALVSVRKCKKRWRACTFLFFRVQYLTKGGGADLFNPETLFWPVLASSRNSDALASCNREQVNVSGFLFMSHCKARSSSADMTILQNFGSIIFAPACLFSVSTKAQFFILFFTFSSTYLVHLLHMY